MQMGENHTCISMAEERNTKEEDEQCSRNCCSHSRLGEKAGHKMSASLLVDVIWL